MPTRMAPILSLDISINPTVGAPSNCRPAQYGIVCGEWKHFQDFFKSSSQPKQSGWIRPMSGKSRVAGRSVISSATLTTRASANIRFRRALSVAWHARRDDRAIIERWYVAEWGGIRSNRAKTFAAYSGLSDEQLISRAMKGIASWSKFWSYVTLKLTQFMTTELLRPSTLCSAAAP